MTARQEIPWSEEWELPWAEQTLASRAAQAVHVAVGFVEHEERWCGDVDSAAQLVAALREAESALLDGFRSGWGPQGAFLSAVLRQRFER